VYDLPEVVGFVFPFVARIHRAVHSVIDFGRGDVDAVAGILLALLVAVAEQPVCRALGNRTLIYFAYAEFAGLVAKESPIAEIAVFDDRTVLIRVAHALPQQFLVGQLFQRKRLAHACPLLT